MKTASEFRAEARGALKNNWLTAIAVSAIVILLGVVGDGGTGIHVNVDVTNGASVDLSVLGQELFSFQHGSLVTTGLFVGIALWVILIAVAGIAFGVIVGGTLRVGYCRYHLGLIRQEESRLDTLLAYFSYWKTAAMAALLQGLYILLWSLLLIVPGIVATYSCAMTEYILAEHPELSAKEAIDQSKAMMNGNRWRLFCLDLSFIGWTILSSLVPLHIGEIVLNPYKETARAAFYRELTAPTAESEPFNDPV